MHSRLNREPLVRPGEIDHHVADLSATFAADMTLATVQATLRRQGQWLPIDGDPAMTLSELVERNSTGPLRLGFGAWRDLLLGVQFRNGEGELITAGGRTVKNVAGYDLTKFMVGQFGCFGKIITLTTRAYKAPDHALLAAFDPDLSKFNTLLVTPCRPQWAVLTADALLCGYVGDGATADFYQAEVPRHGSHELLRHSLDDDIAIRAKLWHARGDSDGFTFRAAVPPAKINAFIRFINATHWVADAAFGIVLGSCAKSLYTAVQHGAQSVGGSAIIFDTSQKPIHLLLDAGADKLLTRLKASFDPHNLLPPLPVKAI